MIRHFRVGGDLQARLEESGVSAAAVLRKARLANDLFAQTRILVTITGHRPTTEDVARRLHMSPRTLQRRLQESGSSFQRVLDEARRQMARH